MGDMGNTGGQPRKSEKTTKHVRISSVPIILGATPQIRENNKTCEDFFDALPYFLMPGLLHVFFFSGGVWGVQDQDRYKCSDVGSL